MDVGKPNNNIDVYQPTKVIHQYRLDIEQDKDQYDTTNDTKLYTEPNTITDQTATQLSAWQYVKGNYKTKQFWSMFSNTLLLSLCWSFAEGMHACQHDTLDFFNTINTLLTVLCYHHCLLQEPTLITFQLLHSCKRIGRKLQYHLAVC